MMKAHHNLINYILDTRGAFMSVWSEGDCLCEPTQDTAAIKRACDSVEVCQLNVYPSRHGTKGNCIGYAVIIPYGVSDDETVANWAPADSFFDEWFESFRAEDYRRK